MNPEAQRLIDTINRLMANGVPRDDTGIQTLERMIEQELSRGTPTPDPSGRNMDFMNPQLQRPFEGAAPPPGVGESPMNMPPNVRPFAGAAGPPPNFAPSAEEELEMIMPEEEFQGEGMGDF